MVWAFPSPALVLGKNQYILQNHDIFLGNQLSWALISYCGWTSTHKLCPPHGCDRLPGCLSTTETSGHEFQGPPNPVKPQMERTTQVTELSARPSMQSQICLLPRDSGQRRPHSLLPKVGRWLAPKGSSSKVQTSCSLLPVFVSDDSHHKLIPF